MRVLLVVPEAEEQHGRAEAAALVDWAAGQGFGAQVVLRPSASALLETDVVWVHALAGVPSFDDDVRAAWRDACARGVGTLLTLLATPLAQWLGAPGDPPNVEGPRTWRDAADPWWPADLRDWPGYPHIRGVQGWGDHPLYRGLQRGTFSWMANDGDRYSRATYTRPHWPPCVIGVDRSYIQLHADHAVAWEYRLGAPVLCLGANILFAAANPRLHPQRDQLLRNALASLLPSAAGHPRRYWPGGGAAVLPPVQQPQALAAAPAAPAAWPADRRDLPDESWITVGSAHGLCVGTGCHGVQELWLHPLCVCDEGMQLRCDGDAAPRCLEVVTSTRHMERTLQFASGSCWTELVIGDHDTPSWALQWTPTGTPSPLVLTWRLPLRLQWPMPEWGLRPLTSDVIRHGTRAVVRVLASDGHHRVSIAIDGAAHVSLTSDGAAPELVITSVRDQPLRVVVSAAGEAPFGVDSDVLPRAVQRVSTDSERHRRADTRLESGDTGLDAAWSWALARLRHFESGALDGTRGLMAGYARSRPGFNRSRPGYAWYFGRDACWCVDALLAAGLHDLAKTAIELLIATRDVTGKVIHERSTSGVAHYDAADATPLLLRAIAAYAEWTGDLDGVRRWWGAAEQGMAYTGSCDRDGDGLPENTDVGHGWIEMGPLGGGATTSYVAAIWMDALRRLVPVALALHHTTTARRLEHALRRARRGLRALRLPGGKLALHRAVDGTLAPWVTALDAVPIALGVDEQGGEATLAALGTPAFTTPWGVRLLSRDDPRYAPRGYHTGSVWPLFTGWAGLADFRVGDPNRGMERLQAVARCTQARNRGAFDEVLDGDTGDGAGVCSDQAWSAAALVSAAVYGLFGIRVHAGEHALRAGGTLPATVPRVALRRLRVHDTVVDCTMERAGNDTAWTVAHIEGPPLWVEWPRRRVPLPCGAVLTQTLHMGTRWPE